MDSSFIPPMPLMDSEGAEFMPSVEQTETLEKRNPPLPASTESDIGMDVTSIRTKDAPVALRRRKRDVNEDQPSMARIPKPQTNLLIESFEMPQSTREETFCPGKGKQSSKSRLPGVNSLEGLDARSNSQQETYR
jgi:hypothetical protein